MNDLLSVGPVGRRAGGASRPDLGTYASAPRKAQRPESPDSEQNHTTTWSADARPDS
jgi:hypothetical protein